jgi:hypothetical protein
MRPSLDDAARIAGWAAMVAALLLSGPGVTLVRAQEAAPESALESQEPVCRAPSATSAAQLEQVARQLRRLSVEGEVPREGVVALNNRGYNHASDPEARLRAIERELSRILQEQR